MGGHKEGCGFPNACRPASIRFVIQRHMFEPWKLVTTCRVNWQPTWLSYAAVNGKPFRTTCSKNVRDHKAAKVAQLWHAGSTEVTCLMPIRPEPHVVRASRVRRAVEPWLAKGLGWHL
jgi:hypothetical protein